MLVARRLGPLVTTVAACGLIVAGPAYALPEKPIVGTTECSALVDKDPKVTAATGAEIAPARKAAEGELCSTASSSSPSSTTSSTTPSSPTTSPKPSGPPGRPGQGPGRPDHPGPPPGRPGDHGHGDGDGDGHDDGADHGHPDRPGRPPGDRDCADFATQDEAQRYFESIGGSATNDADRLDENHNGQACENLDDDGDDQNAAVTTTGDDGSTAATSGTQVTEVPVGSAQTGGSDR